MFETKKIRTLFSKKKPLLKQINLKIPRDFREMTFTEKMHHYPIQDRIPQEAFINQNQDSIIGIRHTKDHLSPDQLKDYKQNVFDKIFNTPSIQNYQSSIIPTRKTPCILVSYTLMMDEPLFVMNLVGSHKETMLFVTFSCPKKNKDQWKTIIEKAFENIKLEIPKN